MKITVEYFRGILSAIVHTSKLTLIAGSNHQGKTSIMQGAAAALTGRILPIDGLEKKHATLLVHSGTTGSRCEVATDAGSCEITYPACVVSTQGTPPTVSSYAAGLESLVDTKPKERADIIANLLHTLPGKADLEKELPNVGKTTLDRIWQTIEANGWDAAHAQAQERGQQSKGSWRAITHENWGSQKGETWLPAGWDMDLQDRTEKDLQDVLTQDQEWLEVAISDQAVSGTEQARLEKLISGKPDLLKLLQDARETLSGLTKNEQDIRKHGRELPPAKQPESQPCPCCKELLAIDAGKIVKASIIPADELERRQKVINETSESLKAVLKEIDTTKDAIGQVNNQLQEIAQAEQQLEQLKNKPASHGHSVDDCRARVQKAKDRLDAFRAKAEADKYHKGIITTQGIIEVLAPAGLRQKFLINTLRSFNAQLRVITDHAGWRPVEIRQDMHVTLGGTIYMLLSESEQYRVRTALQIAFSQLDGSDLMLIDRADILDGPGRNGLFKAILKSGIPAVVAMTLNKLEDVPDLKKHGGNAYWIDSGETKACPTNS